MKSHNVYVRSKPFFIFALIVFLLSATVVFYFTVTDTVTVIQDQSWQMILPKKEIQGLGLKLFTKGYRLKVCTVKQEEVLNPDFLTDVLTQNAKSRFVLLSPVISAACRTLEIDANAILENAYVIGIAADNNKNYFDTVLVSDVRTGWNDVPDNCIVVYDKTSSDIAKSIKGKNKYVEIVDKDTYGSFYGREIVDKAKSDSRTSIVCLNASDMPDFLKYGSGMCFVLDYRYGDVIPKRMLMGTISPKLWDSVKQYIQGNSETREGVLLYGYKETVNGILRQNFWAIQQCFKKFK